jgi:signal peptidase I
MNPSASKEKAPRGKSFKKRYGNLVLLCLLLPLFYFFVIGGMQFFKVPSSSMENTLMPGDYLLTLKVSEYSHGDIVVLRDTSGAGGHLVKRIVAMEGDQVAAWGGALLVNGRYLSEPYIREPLLYEINPPITVPEGQVFLLGDNRNESDDSHLSGKGYPVEDIVGKVRYRYLPAARRGPIASYPARVASPAEE